MSLTVNLLKGSSEEGNALAFEGILFSASELLS
ncbi:unknown [Clostridium sp. CAG:813]|nr:unknown [Clostridium sp. CAG:813]